MRLFDLFKISEIVDVFTSSLKKEAPYNENIKIIYKGPLSTTKRKIISQEDAVPSTVPEFNNSEFQESSLKDTYSYYEPQKLKIGKQHSYSVVESRSLVSVEFPNITYELLLPQNIINDGLLSNVQLEAIVYACQKHEAFISDGKRAGFLIGDGAGVGKGRTVAGIIYENMLAGRKRAIWISISTDLIEDAKRDFRDIGANVNIISLNKLSYKENSYIKNNKQENQVLFLTYASLIGQTKFDPKNAFNTRFDQVINWFGHNYDGVIIFDESHKAKNLSNESKKSKTAVHVKKLQDELLNARIVYSSATGASEIGNMAYMVRLGLWGAGKICLEFQDFEKKLKRHGVSSMELVAMDMKRRGVYIARQLSFKDVEFDVTEVKMEEEKINGHSFKDVYNKCVLMWTKLYKEFNIAYRKNEATSDNVKYFQRIFWSSHQSFFKYLCISGKVPACVRLALSEIEKGKCVVIGLQSTGESKTNSVMAENNGELSEFVSSAKEILISMITKHFPSVANIDKLNRKVKENIIEIDKKENSNSADNNDIIQEEFLKEIQEIDNYFPLNTLDQLKVELGGSDKVAEMTGRKGGIVRKIDGKICYEQRRSADVSLDKMNIDEKNKFNNGSKFIAIISDAASTGISLHSDARFRNKRQRVHITLELPWSADKAIQQFGRTHRSNQVIPPHYRFLITDLSGERRFAATVAKRLESLGALTHGDRRAGDSKDLSQFNFEHEIGLKAVIRIINSILIPVPHCVPFPRDYLTKYNIDKNQFQALAKESLNAVGFDVAKDVTVAKFLNRLLGIEIDMQNALFQYFLDTVEFDIKQAKFQEEFDHGIRDLTSDRMKCEKIKEFSSQSIEAGAKIVLSKMTHVTDGITWETALSRYKEQPLRNHFRFLKNQQFNLVSLFVYVEETELKLITPMFPEQTFKEMDLVKNWQRISMTEAESLWKRLHEGSENGCLHSLADGSECLKRNCSYGKRTKIDYMITGAIFTARSLIDDSGMKIRINVARVQLKDDEKLIGAFFSQIYYDSVVALFSEKYEKQDVVELSSSNNENVAIFSEKYEKQDVVELSDSDNEIICLSD